MSTIGLYTRGMTQPQANAMRRRLNKLAGEHGYFAFSGPTAGQGNLVGLLVALDAGKVATVLLPDGELDLVIAYLEALGEAWATTIAQSLRAALERQADAG